MSATVTPAPYERPRGRGSNLVFKSGPLFISSKGLGWKSWKRRWFILTRTSLVFFKNDPNLLPQKGGDANLTLGGIDLNNSGSVSLRAEKKLLTVLFPPDGSSPEGRTFTLKAETMEDLEEWKIALDRALAAAPNADLVMGHNGIFRNDSIDTVEGSSNSTGQGNRRPVKSLVVGRPILLALEDIDGSPSFLEKALCFIENHGLGVEGILRQSADVDEVERRVRDYEGGHNQFGPDEDAHVIGDCIKHVLRELPSSPVPTPCCTALLEAHRLEGKESRVASMRIAVAESFPEPNRRLLQRVLRMMRAVASHTSENRMTSSAVAACMAPLLLRPLLAGECGLDDDSDVSGDNAAQLLAATTAANNAQSIVNTLMEEYDNIFEDDDSPRVPPSPQMYPNMDGSGSDEESEDEVLQLHDVDGYHDAQNDLDAEVDEDFERVLSGGLSESSGHIDSDVFDYKVYEGGDSDFDSPKGVSRSKGSAKVWTRSVRTTHDRDRAGLGSGHHDNGGSLSANSLNQHSWDSGSPITSPRLGAAGPPGPGPGSGTSLRPKGHASTATSRRSIWGITTSSNKTVAADMTDSSEEELAIQRLEATRNELRNKIAKEAKGNAVLQASLERRKQALHDRRLALEQDVTRLQSQLQVERELRAALEMGLSMSAAQMSTAQSLDSKTRAELEEIAVVEADVARLKQKVAELHLQLSQQKQQQGGSLSDASDRHERVRNLQAQQTQLQKELEQTLALCHQEKQKNDEQLDGGSGSEDAGALELVVAQQRNALAEAKEALNMERARGQDLRRKPGSNQGNQALQINPLNQLNQMDPGGDWRTLRPPAGPSSAGRQFAWRPQKPDAYSIGDLGTELVNGSGYTSDGGASSSSGKKSNAEAEGASTNSMESHRQPPAASAALAELTTRLDFFKERRSQLMEQLHTLDPTLVPPNLNGHDLIPASPPLTSP
ncbi:protein MpREN [Marchantia polymorpha subsp. ruderalis]|uniref:Rho-GAP domain-containing protein n=1 Tax=Marchantia polymorpha TaxID=3197 RepID=A0A2R6XN26_MARPO|nr:hypothetical protein MARPO_0008s0253 [Marchantia polymorpha]BBN19325.1 hypothetical protein Mp_8g09680 [Marchantia polymorpha subsp. ruderalis]|eukprot:PTQ47508.1 hypothetical protein MARPO_0008s0253 [Marchantia polymorpha]